MGSGSSIPPSLSKHDFLPALLSENPLQPSPILGACCLRRTPSIDRPTPGYERLSPVTPIESFQIATGLIFEPFGEVRYKGTARLDNGGGVGNV